MFRIFIIIISLFFISESLFAQKFRHRKEKKVAAYSKKVQSVFPDPFEYDLKGWHFDPALTYEITRPFPKKISGDEGETTFKPRGKIRGYLGIGRYRIVEYWYLVNYVDYGLAYKWMAGRELYEGAGGSGENKFNDHHLTGNLNFNNIKDLQNGFLQNSLGLNVDYKFLGAGSSPFIAQLHYKIGYGYKPNDKWLIIPSLEFPLMSFYPGIPNPMLQYFSSRYLPVIFSVRLMRIKKKTEDCPPVGNPAMPSLQEMQDMMQQENQR